MKLINNSKTGIISYGSYIPKYRIKVEEIAAAWGTDPEQYKKGLGLVEKSVPGLDEDTISIAVNAALQAQERLSKGVNIGAIYTGSESHPYAVKPSGTIIAEALALGNDYTSADLEFACKAGTAAIQIVTGLIETGRVEAGLAIGADTAQGAPGDALEYSAGCGAAAFILGSQNVIAKLVHTTSFTSDTPDFWRREHEHFPQHGGRFTGEPGYFRHVISTTKKYLEETGTQIQDYDHLVFHMPNGKFPAAVAKILKASPEQIKNGMIVTHVGNLYSACSLIGLASVLDVAKPKEKILIISYGSGAGSDAIGFEITDEITKYRKNKPKFDRNISDQIADRQYLNYGQYVRHTGKLLE